MITPENPLTTISGVIGIGKSTAGKMIADRLDFTFYPEPDPYKIPGIGVPGKEFLMETAWLHEKIGILARANEQRKRTGVMIDVWIAQDVEDYAQSKLSGEELKNYFNLYEAYRDRYQIDTIIPSLIIYLRAQASVVLERIHSRGRDFEQGLTRSDIEKHDELNLKWIEKSKLPAVFIDTDNLDIVHSESARQHMVKQVRDKLDGSLLK